jgi:hypothetical protein
MSQVVTLNLPDNFFQPLERTARATRQPIEKLLLNALQNSLPPLEGLPPEFIENLTALENLENSELQMIMRETVPLKTQKEISALLNSQDKCSEEEAAKLATLQEQADLVMLRKARAAVLLRFRGHRLPTLAELENLSLPK